VESERTWKGNAKLYRDIYEQTLDRFRRQ
jgi:hypothetical protein